MTWRFRVSAGSSGRNISSEPREPCSRSSGTPPAAMDLVVHLEAIDGSVAALDGCRWIAGHREFFLSEPQRGAPRHGHAEKQAPRHARAHGRPSFGAIELGVRNARSRTSLRSSTGLEVEHMLPRPPGFWPLRAQPCPVRPLYHYRPWRPAQVRPHGLVLLVAQFAADIAALQN